MKIVSTLIAAGIVVADESVLFSPVIVKSDRGQISMEHAPSRHPGHKAGVLFRGEKRSEEREVNGTGRRLKCFSIKQK